MAYLGDGFIESLITSLNNGESLETNPSKNTLFKHISIFGILGRHILEGKELSQNTKEYLHNAFCDIAKGIEPHKALKLNGRKKSSLSIRNYEIALVVSDSISDGLGAEKAMRQLARSNSLSYETVRSAYYEYTPIIEAEKQMMWELHIEQMEKQQ